MDAFERSVMPIAGDGGTVELWEGALRACVNRNLKPSNRTEFINDRTEQKSDQAASSPCMFSRRQVDP